LIPLLPKRGTRGDRDQNSLRVRVEHVFGQLDRCRRIVLRYDARMPAFRAYARAYAQIVSRTGMYQGDLQNHVVAHEATSFTLKSLVRARTVALRLYVAR